MIIKEINLKNYRNIDNVKIKLSENINIFIGKNAQGKTNLLESIFVGSVCKSFRLSRERDLVKWGEKKNYIGIIFLRKGKEKKIEIITDKNEGTKIKINNLTLEKKSEIIGIMNAVIFSPESINIINGTPSDRRRYIDISISKLKPKYAYELTKYKKIILQRNSILKKIKSVEEYRNIIDIWNEYLIETGVEIIKYRTEFIKKINSSSQNIHYKLSGKNEKLEILYKCGITKDTECSYEQLKSSFKRKIDEGYEKEIERKSTLFGPHLDDVEIYINGRESKIFSSQGQKRTASLSLVLSETEIIKNESGEYPVLLLDDVFSELDSERKKYLLEYIEKMQTVITTTDDENIETKEKKEKMIFLINNGNIIRRGD